MNVESLFAVEAIRKTMAEYVSHTDNGRTREFGLLFGETGEFVLPDGSSYGGAAAITAALEGHGAYFQANPDKAPLDYLRHHAATADICLTGERTATAECYFISVTQERVDHWGKWIDQFVRAQDGRWLFARRVVVTDGYDPAGWFATIFSQM